MNEIEQRMYGFAERLLIAYHEIHAILKSDTFSSIRNLSVKSGLDTKQVKEALAALDGPYGHSRGWSVEGKHEPVSGPTVDFHGSPVNKIRIYRR